MIALRLAVLFARRQRVNDRLAGALPVAAFAVVVAMLLLVLGGAGALLNIDNPMAGIYQALTVLALALLVVPLITLGAAAAKLSARRRDARLSSLVLLGATQSQVAALTVVESVTAALTGALIGTAGYALLVPLMGLVEMGGSQLGASLWLPWYWLPLVWLGVSLVAAVSALFGLRGVLVTPLGVRARQLPRLAKKRRVLIAAALVGLGLLFMVGMTAIGELSGPIGIFIGIFVAFGCGILALDTVGPWYLALRAKFALRRAQNVERILAARAILDDPLSAWRNVAGLALTTFISVIAAAGLGIVDLASGSITSADELQLFIDIRTGAYLTLAIAFVMVAATVAISQAANTLDRARVHVAMDWLGVPQDLMARAARRSVMSAVTGVMAGAAILAALLMFPLVGISLLMRPVALLAMAVAFVLGVLLVRAAASVSGRLVPGILARPERIL